MATLLPDISAVAARKVPDMLTDAALALNTHARPLLDGVQSFQVGAPASY